MKKNGAVVKRLLAIVAAFSIAVSMMPTNVLASETTNTLNDDADAYVWNLTSQQTYLPPSGTNGSQRHHRAADAWRAQYWSGTTTDGYVQIHVKNINTSKDYYQCIDAYHECSQPKSSYAPGEEVALTMRAYVQNPVNYAFFRGSSSLYISEENKDADGIEFGTYVSNNKNAVDRFAERGESSTSLSPRDESAGEYVNASTTVYADMPKRTTEGEHIAIVFYDNSASDGVSLSPQYEYGGNAFHLWIYTLQKKASQTKPVTVKVDKTKITKVKKTNSKKFRVTWKKVSNISGYQVQISKTKKFKKASTTTKKASSKNNYIDMKNYAKGTYYLRVRAYKTVSGKTTYGAWSAVKQFKWKK